MRKMIALLRGINVGSTRSIPMADLRALVAAEGFDHVATYIQSGNVVFSSTRPAATVTAKLESAIARRFGFAVEVIVRDEDAWRHIVAGCPFAAVARDRPKQLHLCLAAEALKGDVAETLRARAAHGERVEVVDEALWIDFAGGVGPSKLTPAALDRAAGSCVTARNWNTVAQLSEMLSGA